MEASEARLRLGQEVTLLSRRWRARLDQELKATGLSQARWMALVELSRCEGLTQKELAERLGIEGPTLVRQLDDLERRGLIERRPGSMDRRANQVRVTPAAGPVLTEIAELATALRRELLGGISDDEIVACVGVLQSINERLDAK